jgi:uncharacterized membrane protein
MQQNPAPVSVFRLRFIDMARSVAILLMLEGHFVDLVLAEKWRVAGHPFYEVWLHVRGLAAPMFFMVTGVIFSYLLGGAVEASFFRIKRVRRGLLRAAELIVWGYFLQTDLSRLPDMLREGPDRWLGAFHVLQCIACGLLVMIALHGLARRAGWQVLAAVHLLAGFALFIVSVVLANHSGQLPVGAPEWLQNPVKGPIGPFPIAPWLGYTFYGAAVGVMLRKPATAGVSPAVFLGVGVALAIGGWYFDRAIGGALLDLTGMRGPHAILPDAFHGRVGEILIMLGLAASPALALRKCSREPSTHGRPPREPLCSAPYSASPPNGSNRSRCAGGRGAGRGSEDIVACWRRSEWRFS